MKSKDKKNTHHIEGLFHKGLAFHRAGNLQQASECYSELLILQPENAMAINNMALIARDLGRSDIALSMLKEALSHASDDISILKNIAAMQLQAGDPNSAETHLRKALAISPHMPDLRLSLGHVLYARKQFSEAKATFKGLLRDQQVNLDVLYNLGIIYMRENNAEEAIDCLQKALLIKPRDSATLNQLAEQFLLLDRVGEARDLLERSLAANSFNTRALSLQVVLFNRCQDEASLKSLLNFPALLQVHKLEVSSNYASVEDFNLQLVHFLDKDVSMTPDPEGKSTVNGVQSPLICHLQDASIEEMNRQIIQAYEAALVVCQGLPDHPFSRGKLSRVKLDSWTVRLRSGGFQSPHIHSGAWLSGCYYLKVPQEVSSTNNQSKEGWLEFGKPDAKFGIDHALVSTDYQPVAGELVTFPSYFWHNTIPFFSAEERISVAFDICPLT